MFFIYVKYWQSPSKGNAREDQSLMDLDSIRDPISPEASRLVDGAVSIVYVSLNLI